MNNKNITFRIIKFIVIVGCAIGVVFRIVIPFKYVNYYMAGVNVLSFFVAINLFLVECYIELKKEYNEIKEKLNVIRKKGVEDGIMIFYVFIYIMDIIFIFVLIFFYTKFKIKMAVLNDILGIISLGMAISTDLMSKIVVGILMWWFECTSS